MGKKQIGTEMSLYRDVKGGAGQKANGSQGVALWKESLGGEKKKNKESNGKGIGAKATPTTKDKKSEV